MTMQEAKRITEATPGTYRAPISERCKAAGRAGFTSALQGYRLRPQSWLSLPEVEAYKVGWISGARARSLQRDRVLAIAAGVSPKTLEYARAAFAGGICKDF